MGNQVIQPSLTGGVLAPALHGRVDLARYGNSLKTLRNFEVSPYGGVRNRPGFRFRSEVKDSSKRVRLLPFIYNTSQAYAVEMGDGYLRVFQGGVAVTAAVWTPWVTAHNYAPGDRVSYAGQNYVCLNYHTSGTFSIDMAVYEAWSSSGVAGGTLELATPYTVAELRAIRCIQSADVMTLVHPNHPPMQLKRYAADDWRLETQALDSGPFQEINTDKGLSVWSSANVGAVTLSASKDLFYAKHVGQLFRLDQKDFGQAWEAGKAVGIGDVRRAHGLYYMALTTGTTGTNIPTGTDEHWNDGGVDWGYVHAGYGVARITGITDAKTASATVLSRLPDGSTTAGFGASKAVGTNTTSADGNIQATVTAHGLTVGSYGVALVTFSLHDSGTGGDFGPFEETCGYSVIDANTIKFNHARAENHGFTYTWTATSFKPPLGGTNQASYKWAWGSFGDPAIGGPGYPAAVTYYQQRLCFAGTANQPSAIWMSRTGSYSDFSVSNPIQDDDAVTYTVVGNQHNGITGLLDLDKLLILTSGAIYCTGTGSNTDVITPSNLGAKLQSYRGVSDLPTLGIGGSALFVGAYGQVVGDLAYEAISEKFGGQDLTAFASHLFEGHQIVEWAFQRNPNQTVWAAREDGALLGLTYMREQEIAAWHPHDTDGEVESVCVVPGATEDTLYLAIKRTVNGQTRRYIETREPRLITDIESAFFVDSGLSCDGRNTTATTISLSGGTLYDETEVVAVTASSAMFTGTSDVADQLVMWDGNTAYRLTITAYTDSTHAQARPNRAIPAAFRSARADWAWARDTFAGLGHLEGKTVSILADGSVRTQAVVTAGKVTLAPPAVRVHVGLPIQADLETLDLSVQGIETLLPKNKSIPSVTFLVHESRAIWAGRDFDHLMEAKAPLPLGDKPINLQTGKVQIRVQTSWTKGGQVCLRVNDPVPVSILAIIPEVVQGAA